MAYLIAVGPEPEHRWRRTLRNGEIVRLGRAPRVGLKVPWDRHISREHAELELINDELVVRRLDTARNSIFFREESSSEFRLCLGESFRIGKTEFSLGEIEFSAEVSSEIQERSFGPDQLRQVEFGNAAEWLETLARLPKLMAASQSNQAFATQVVGLALNAIPHAQVAAIMHYDLAGDSGLERPLLMEWDSRDKNFEFRPSRRLIRAAIEGEKSVIHFWTNEADQNQYFTCSGDSDWAMCAPGHEQACRGWCLYVSGKLNQIGWKPEFTEEELKRDLRFSELLVQFVGSISQIRSLERLKTHMSQFFSPAVVSTLGDVDSADALEPKESDISVLFCDVRGFSRRAEQATHQLRELLDRTSDALGVMTQCIMKYEGVIADFQGDAALAFWGWPEALAEGPLLACRAALAMQAEFERANQTPEHSLAGFQVGIGVGFGSAIAGKIGSPHQAKVGVFGPVVNLASRLEGMTKLFGVPILIDEQTADFVNRLLPDNEGRCRQLGRVRPVGLDADVMAWELMPPAHCDGTIDDAAISQHQQAVEAFTAGRWDEARRLIEGLPPHDQASRLLISFMDEHQSTPPDAWDGIIPLKTK